MKFEIDPDISRARTLPAAVYSEPAYYEAITERIFARSWQPVTGDIPVNPSCATGGTLLPGCLDEPVALSRDADGVLHVLSNVCTHRANLVVNSDCTGRTLRCGYHGRRFGLDGKFISMPGFTGACEFPSSSDDLPRLASAQLGPLLFASVNPAFDFEALVAPVRERVDLSDLPASPTTVRDYDVAANWALYCDNFLEGFHIPFVHPGLNAALDGYDTELFELCNLQVGLTDGKIVAHYFWLFPNIMLNVYPWGLSLNVVMPLAVDRTRVRFASYVRDPSLLGTGAGADLDTVEMEDEAVVENVQRGVRSRLYDRGRYSPTRERGVHHFHQLLARYLTPTI